MVKIRIGKRNHTLSVVFRKYFLAVLCAVFADILFLKIFKPHKKQRIVLAGHRLNGNLKAFYEYLSYQQKDFEVLFFTDDPFYFKKSKQRAPDMNIYSLQKLSHLKLAAASRVVCTSHGPLSLSLWRKSKNRPLFIELWHGAGFKNRKIDETKPRLFYDAIFVSSPTFGQFHKEWGYSSKQIRVTGYSQVDSLASKPNEHELSLIKEQFDLHDIGDKKIVLYAPTWNSSNNEDTRQFDQPITEVLGELERSVKNLNAIILVLPHINSALKLPEDTNNLKIISSNGELDIKPLLHITDVLITDWSSIYTDFLALPEKKPVIFLDNPPTFYGFTLTPEDRAGDIVKSTRQLVSSLEGSLTAPYEYIGKYSDKISRVTYKTWGDTLDGKSSERYLIEIKRLLKNE